MWLHVAWATVVGRVLDCVGPCAVACGCVRLCMTAAGSLWLLAAQAQATACTMVSLLVDSMQQLSSDLKKLHSLPIIGLLADQARLLPGNRDVVFEVNEVRFALDLRTTHQHRDTPRDRLKTAHANHCSRVPE